MEKESNINDEVILQQLSKVFVLNTLTVNERKALFSLSEIVKYQPGEVIVNEGEESHYLFVILSGTLNVKIKNDKKAEVLIASIDEGEIFGEAGLFLNMKRSAKVDAKTDTTLMRIERKKFIQFIEKHHRAGMKTLLVIIYRLLHRLRESNEEMVLEKKSNFKRENIDIDFLQFLNSDDEPPLVF
ncbi:MAG: cyclic nucleotide-binding domain-containing protein [Spirochaetes bacterium]|nr:cyclic nucleotide-binding domain-containing protein [Spirochaetota bacterium]